MKKVLIISTGGVIYGLDIQLKSSHHSPLTQKFSGVKNLHDSRKGITREALFNCAIYYF